SGKSIGYDDPLVIAECRSGEMRPQVRAAGPFIDSLMREHGGASGQDCETEKLTPSGSTYFTPAFDAERGTTAWFPVSALLRHRAPTHMFRVTTTCGRTVTATADHNFWVLRDGVPRLLKTEDVLGTDLLPSPDELTVFPEGLKTLDVLQYLGDTRLSVYAEDMVLDHVANGGEGEFRAALASFVDPGSKLSAIRHGRRGRGIRIQHFLRLLNHSTGLQERYSANLNSAWVGLRKVQCRIPARLPLSEELLALI